MSQSLGAKPVGEITSKLEEDFRSRVMVTDSCHVWAGSSLESGHGKISRKRADGTFGMVLAHRVAYAIYHEEPGERVVRHKCDNAWCVAPYHLEIGYAADNVRDAFERGQLSAKGTRNPIHWAGGGVFTDEKVREARRLKAGGLSNKEVADQLGVNRRTAADVLNGVSWTYVSSEVVA